jgi:hypothetical protein
MGLEKRSQPSLGHIQYRTHQLFDLPTQTIPLNKTDHQMDLISLVVTLIVVGVLLWLVNNYIPMDGQIKRLLNAVVVISTVIWLLNAFGVLNSIRGVRIGS